MAKARVLKIVNYREEDIPKLNKLEEVLRRENKEFTEWVREQTDMYIRTHGDGNPNYRLEQFEKEEFRAWPTAWENWDAGFDKTLPDEEFMEMAKLIKNKTRLMNDRVKRLDWKWAWV